MRPGLEGQSYRAKLPGPDPPTRQLANRSHTNIFRLNRIHFPFQIHKSKSTDSRPGRRQQPSSVALPRAIPSHHIDRQDHKQQTNQESREGAHTTKP
jgi:hypothetical protein